jgi:hypothetical protein
MNLTNYLKKVKANYTQTNRLNKKAEIESKKMEDYFSAVEGLKEKYHYNEVHTELLMVTTDIESLELKRIQLYLKIFSLVSQKMRKTGISYQAIFDFFAENGISFNVIDYNDFDEYADLLNWDDLDYTNNEIITSYPKDVILSMDAIYDENFCDNIMIKSKEMIMALAKNKD